MNYYIIVNSEQQGPYTIEELAQRHIDSSTLVWTEGMANWTPAWEVAELRPLFAGADTPTGGTQSTVPPIPNATTVQGNTTTQSLQQSTGAQPTEEPEDADKHRDRSKTALTAVLIAFAILVVLALTAPNKAKHEEAIIDELSEVAVNHINSDSNTTDDIFGTLLRQFSSAITTQLITATVNSMLHVHNYIICSCGSMEWQGKQYTVSFGMLGHVWTFHADDVEKALEQSDQINRLEQQNINQDTDAAADQAADDASKAVDKVMQGVGTSIDHQVQQVTKQVSEDVKQQVKDEINKQVQQNTDSTNQGAVTRIINDIEKLLGL